MHKLINHDTSEHIIIVQTNFWFTKYVPSTACDDSEFGGEVLVSLCDVGDGCKVVAKKCNAKKM